MRQGHPLCGRWVSSGPQVHEPAKGDTQAPYRQRFRFSPRTVFTTSTTLGAAFTIGLATRTMVRMSLPMFIVAS